MIVPIKQHIKPKAGRFQVLIASLTMKKRKCLKMKKINMLKHGCVIYGQGKGILPKIVNELYPKSGIINSEI
jgi:hypothetical protein